MAPQKNANHEALRLFAIADAHRRLAEQHRGLRIYYSSDPKSELAKLEHRKAGEQAKAAQAAFRAICSERWQLLIDHGLASCGAIVGGQSLDDAVKRIDAYARMTAATRKLWHESRERGMVFDPATSLSFLRTDDVWYDGRVLGSIEVETSMRMLIAGCFRSAKRPKDAIEQYTRVMALDPAHSDALLYRSLSYLKLKPPRHKLALADMERHERLSGPRNRGR